MRGLGVRQRRMLTDMALHGQGRWPSGWKARHHHHEVIASLHGKGMVDSPELSTARLTDSGALCASWLHGDRS